MSRAFIAARILTAAAVIAAPLLTLAVGGAPAQAAQPPRVVMILMDTNYSYAWQTQIADENRAALSYVHALPADVQFGLIVFNDTWQTVLQPTADRSRLNSALAAAQTAGRTSRGLAGALAGATRIIDHLGSASQSSLLVLTDGEYLKQPKLTVSLPVDVITWHVDKDDYVRIAEQVATSTGGHISQPGGASGLARYLPKVHQARPPAPAPAPAPKWRVTSSLLVVLAVVFIALLVLALMFLRSLRRGSQRPELAGQIARYGPMSTAEGTGAQQRETKLAQVAVGLMARMLKARNAEPRLAARLDRAGITRPPAEWALLGLCLGAGIAAGITLLTGNVVFGVLIGILGGWLGMRVILEFKIARRRAAFDDQLPNVLQLIAGSIQSGFSLAQAIDAVVREEPQPAAGEFARAIGEARLGVDLDVALDGIADRLNSADLRWVIMAIRIQRETGGNLAEVLRNTVGTMRERAYLRRQVRSLSAEGRLSAYVLIALPILVSGWMFISDPSYMQPLYTTLVGIGMILIVVVLMVIGIFWMRKVVKVEE